MTFDQKLRLFLLTMVSCALVWFVIRIGMIILGGTK